MAKKLSAWTLLVIGSLMLAFAAAAAAQQPQYQVPDYTTPGEQAPDEGAGPDTGAGDTPVAPDDTGAGPGSGEGAPGATLPRTGSETAILFTVLGFVLLLAGVAVRRGVPTRNP
jgi:LPXTG-motif cell wall-anchored protein